MRSAFPTNVPAAGRPSHLQTLPALGSRQRFCGLSEHARLLAHVRPRQRLQTPTGPCSSPAVFIGSGWGPSAPASPGTMEQLGKRSGPAARLDTILRHLSPRLGAAPAPVSFLMWGGKRGGGGVSRTYAPFGVRALLPSPQRALPIAPRTLRAGVCVGTEEGFGGGLPYKDTLPGKDTGTMCVLVMGW